MKEVTKAEGGYTDILDPNGKPYLVLDNNTGQYHVLYWKAWFQGPRWIASDWYETPEMTHETKASRKANGWPKPFRVWELPGVEYDPPTNYTHTS